MVKYFLFSLFLISTKYSYSSITILSKDPLASQVYITCTATGMRLSLTDYIKLNPSDIKRITGQKLTLRELIAFKVTQKKIKKAIKKDGMVNILQLHGKPSERFKWHWGGFFLGLFLPVIGIIISLFIKDDEKRNRITSAAIGTLTIMTIGTIILIINLSNDF